VGNVYGSVIGYDGGPTKDQVDRTAALAHELDDVFRLPKRGRPTLPSLNAALGKKKLEPIKVLSTGDWDKLHAEGGANLGFTRRRR